MHKSLVVIFLGLLGSMAGEQVSAQVSVSPSPGTGSAHAVPVVSAGVSKHGGVTTFTVQPKQAQAGAGIDFVNAKSLELPAVAPRSELQAHYDLMDALQARPQLGGAGFSPGSDGHGHTSPVDLGAPMGAAAGVDEVAPQEFGTTNHPFSTARADLFELITSNAYPYRASGKLFFNIGASSYVCSASLIKRGVVVTAAHCVANFGTNQFYSNWSFVPAYSNGIAPYGVWSVRSATVMTSYLNGTDSCAVPGIVCQDDVALLLLNSSPAGAYPGTATGWYGWGYKRLWIHRRWTHSDHADRVSGLPG